MSIFAQIANVPPQSWYNATLIAVGVIMLLVSLSGAVVGWLGYAQSRRNQSREITPQPLVVGADDPFVTESVFRRELKAIADELAKAESKTDTVATTLDKHLGDSTGYRLDLEKHFTDIRREMVAGDKEVADDVFRRLNEVNASLSSDIKQMPAQIVVILKNTGAIK